MARCLCFWMIFQLFIASAVAAEEFECVIDPAATVRVGSPIPGLLESVMIRRGDWVTKGEVIARISSDVEEATVDLFSEQAGSRAEIEAQLARHKLAESKLARTQELRNRKVATEEKLEEATAESEVLKRELALAEMRSRIARLELERAKRVVEQRIIRSPIDGVVVDRSLSAGEFLDQDGEVATIAQLDPLYVEAFLPVLYFGKIQIGSTANVKPNTPIEGKFDGTVKVVDRVFDAASGTFGVRIELRNPNNRIPAGHRCRVSFQDMTD